jgi:PAS domain S-box-containing protein
VWPPTGIALAAFLLLGYRVWPAILLAAFLVNLTTAGSVATSIGIALGNTFEGLLGAYLVNKLAGGRNVFERAHNILKFAVLVGMLSTAVSATFGVTSLSLGGYANWANYWSIWLTWWLGDAVGVLLVAPLLVLWYAHPHVKWNWGKQLEATILLLCLSLVAKIAFDMWPPEFKNYLLAFLCIPLLCWVACRFGQREAVTATCVVSAIALWGTLHGFGPFAREAKNESLLLLQVYTAVLAVMGLTLAASTAERKQAENKFRRLVEYAPNAIVMVGPQGDIVLLNSQAENLFGYKRDELIGRSVETLVPQRFRNQHPAYRTGFSTRPRARPMGAGRDLYAVRKDGSEFPVEIGLNPIETSEGILIISAIVDITERKRAEEALRRAHDELELRVQQRTIELSSAIEKLQAEISERKQAVQAVHLLSGRLLQSQDEERRRIARELHDSTGQKVAALAIDLAAVGEGAAALQPSARKALSECLSLSDEISSEVRTLSYLLHPPLLDEIGLVPAIRWYADGAAQRGSLQMDLEIPRKLDRLPRETETALFRIVQESLTNILLHSGSKKAKISITQDSQKITLEVSDEGQGIPPGILNHSNGSRRLGVGIVGMRERMKQLGGRLEINSDSGGTIVRAIAPFGGDS